jgi:hypothetical protein
VVFRSPIDAILPGTGKTAGNQSVPPLCRHQNSGFVADSYSRAIIISFAQLREVASEPTR